MTRRNETLALDATSVELEVILLEVIVAILETVAGACVIGRPLRDLPEPYRTALSNLISGPTSADEASGIMREAGIPGSATAIRLHRRGLCACR